MVLKIRTRKYFVNTRMHSTRMRTGRSLTIHRSLLPGGWGGGGCLFLLRGCLPPGGVCSLGVSALGGGGCLLPGGVCSWGVSALGGVSAPGGVCSGGCLLLGVSASGGGGVCSGGCLLQGGSALGGVCSWGVSAQGGCGIPACTEVDTPPVNRMTDRCKNITLATTSLLPVINR